ncbi:sperm equatorial segment protein 1-like [Monodelphis domestica]|uniref:sperm equatorial segment protein 1-like n=1 Tax=Monodelphis domestica TaxID=13616 RepID=UPI0004431B80|nr:sperm equatorial segment protein 1-like [Monodelphis domestica]
MGFHGCWELRCLGLPASPSSVPRASQSHGGVLQKMPLKPAVLLAATLLLWPIPTRVHPYAKEPYTEGESSAPAVISAIGPDMELAVKLDLEPVLMLDVKSLEPEAKPMISAIKQPRPLKNPAMPSFLKALDSGSEPIIKKQATTPCGKGRPPVTQTTKSHQTLVVIPTRKIPGESTSMKSTQGLGGRVILKPTREIPGVSTSMQSIVGSGGRLVIKPTREIPGESTSTKSMSMKTTPEPSGELGLKFTLEIPGEQTSIKPKVGPGERVKLKPTGELRREPTSMKPTQRPSGTVTLKPTPELPKEPTSMKPIKELNLPLENHGKLKVFAEIDNSVFQLKQVVRAQLMMVDTLTKNNSKSQSNSLATGKYEPLKNQLGYKNMIEDQILKSVLETNKLIKHALVNTKQNTELKNNVDSTKESLVPNLFSEAADLSQKKLNKPQKIRESDDNKDIALFINFLYDIKAELSIYLNINNIPLDIRDKAATLFTIMGDIFCKNEQRRRIIKILLKDNLRMLNILNSLLH